MLKHILLPTDGSALSERAVPLAETIARAQGASITAVRVVEPLGWIHDDLSDYVSTESYQRLLQQIERTANRRLERLGEYLRQGGFPTNTVLLTGAPEAELLEYTQQHHPDLVVMSTHGYSGMVRSALGSVTDRLLRDGVAPVLAVRPSGDALTPLRCALVPLDGSEVAEAAVPFVVELAGRPVRQVRLLRVVERLAEQRAAEEYLVEVASRLAQASVEVETEVRLGRAADEIRRAAEGMDLIIISTHARQGMQRVLLGSVAESVASHLDIPCLLVRGTLGSERATEPTGAEAVPA